MGPLAYSKVARIYQIITLNCIKSIGGYDLINFFLSDKKNGEGNC